jgi:hypothetical protein
MADTNYAVCFGATCFNERGGTLFIAPGASSSTAPTTQATSSIAIANREFNGSTFVLIDASVVTMTIFGS